MVSQEAIILQANLTLGQPSFHLKATVCVWLVCGLLGCLSDNNVCIATLRAMSYHFALFRHLTSQRHELIHYLPSCNLIISGLVQPRSVNRVSLAIPAADFVDSKVLSARVHEFTDPCH